MKSLGLESCSTLEGWVKSTNKQNAIGAGIFFFIFLLTFWWYSNLTEKNSYDSPSAEAQGSSQNQSNNSYPTQGEEIATKTNPVRVYVDTQKNTKIDIMDNDIKIGEGALYTREDGLVSPVKITRGGTEQIHITQSGVYILTPINRPSIKVRWRPG